MRILSQSINLVICHHCKDDLGVVTFHERYGTLLFYQCNYICILFAHVICIRSASDSGYPTFLLELYTIKTDNNYVILNRYGYAMQLGE